MTDASPLTLSAEQLSVGFQVRGRGVARETFRAVIDADLEVRSGFTVGVVGESGCGKSTLARALVGLQRPLDGCVSLGGQNLWSMSTGARQRWVSERVGMVFQDPSSSLNPRLTVDQILTDPLRVHRQPGSAERVHEVLHIVGLPERMRERRPSELSGGQRQRVAIARALTLSPEIVVADEPTSALDVSVRAQVLNLLRGLRERLGLGMLFISHDIHTIRWLSDRIVVMYLGRIVEEGPAADVAASPRHPYTAALFSATPSVHGRTSKRIVLEGTPPSPRKPPSGCPFRTRCWRADETCAKAFPPAVHENGRRFHCYHPLPG